MDKEKIKHFSRSSWRMYKLVGLMVGIRGKMGGVKVVYQQGVKIKKHVLGHGNSFKAGNGCLIDNVMLRIVGNNNRVIIGRNVTMRDHCSLYLFGNNCTIVIGDGTSMSHHCQIEVQEEGGCIVLGKDCMLSNNILIRNNDSHFIYDTVSGERTNMPADVVIGDHVWLSAYTTVLKGVHISNGSIVGYRSVVTKDIPENVVAVGTPAKVVKQNAEWTISPRER